MGVKVPDAEVSIPLRYAGNEQYQFVEVVAFEGVSIPLRYAGNSPLWLEF